MGFEAVGMDEARQKERAVSNAAPTLSWEGGVTHGLGMSLFCYGRMRSFQGEDVQGYVQDDI